MLTRKREWFLLFSSWKIQWNNDVKTGWRKRVTLSWPRVGNPSETPNYRIHALFSIWANQFHILLIGWHIKSEKGTSEHISWSIRRWLMERNWKWWGFGYSSGFLCVIIGDAPFPARRNFKKMSVSLFFYLDLGWANWGGKGHVDGKTTGRVQQGDDGVVFIIP